MDDETIADRRETVEGGDTACWLHLVCPSCGAVAASADRHRPDCAAAAGETDVR